MLKTKCRRVIYHDLIVIFVKGQFWLTTRVNPAFVQHIFTCCLCVRSCNQLHFPAIAAVLGHEVSLGRHYELGNTKEKLNKTNIQHNKTVPWDGWKWSSGCCRHFEESSGQWHLNGYGLYVRVDNIIDIWEQCISFTIQRTFFHVKQRSQHSN